MATFLSCPCSRRTRWGLLAAWFALQLAPFSHPAAAEPATHHEVPAGKAAIVQIPVDPTLTAAGATLLPGGPILRASIATDHGIRILRSAEERVWVGFGDGAFAQLDPNADPAALEPVQVPGAQERPRTISQLQVRNEKLYIADDNQSVWMRDATSGAQLAQQPVFATSSSVRDLAANESTLFVALADGTVWSVDVTRPDTPVRLAQIPLGHTPRRLALTDQWLWVAHGEGLSVIDVAQPAAPAPRASHRIPEGGVYDLAVADDLVVAAVGRQGVAIFDMEPEVGLRWRGGHQATGDTRRIAASGALAAAAEVRGYVTVLDISLPNLPGITHVLPAMSDVSQLAVVADKVVVANPNTIELWDVSAAAPRYSNDALNAGEGINYGGQRKGQLVGDVLFVADWFSGLHVYDVSFPQEPQLLSSYHTPGSPKGVAVKDGLAYIADDDHGLQVVDISNPRAPTFVAALQTEGLAYTPVIAEDGKLYLASHRGGFQIIDIAARDQPRLLGQIDTPGKAWSIAVDKQIAYVADSEGGLLIFDVRDSAQPQLIGQFSPGGNAEDVWVEGSTAYVAFFDDGLYELDISDPSAPQVRAHLSTPGNARGLEKIGNALFVADWFAGVHMVDVQEPGNPQLRGSYDTPGAAWGLRVSGDSAFVFDWWGGLVVLDVAQRDRPRWLADYNQSTPARALAVRGRHLYAAQGERGLQVFDVNNPLNPTWTTGLELPGIARDIALRGHLALVAADRAGLVVVDISDPFRPRQIASLRLPFGAQRVQLTEQAALILDDTGGVARVTWGADADLQMTWYRPQGWRDIAAAKHNVYGLTNAGALAVGHIAMPPQNWQSWAVDYHATHLAAATAWLAIAGRDNAIRFYTTPALEAKPAATLPMASPVTALAADNRTLYVALADGGLVIVDAEQASQPRVRSVYPGRHTLTALLPHGRHLYGGGSYLWAVSPSAPVSSTLVRPGVLELSLPNTLPEGSYHLRLDTAGAQKEIPNAVTVTSLIRRLPRAAP